MMSALTMLISSMIINSTSLMSLIFSALYLSVLRIFLTEYRLSSGSKGWKGSLKKLCKVAPPALIAAIPVGARMMCFFLVVVAIYFKSVDLPVPALPVRKSERRVNLTIWSAFCNSGLSKSILSFVLSALEVI